MAKKKKKKKLENDEVVKADFTNFEDYPMLQGVIPETHHHFLTIANNQTLDAFTDWWKEQMEANHKNRLWKRFGGVTTLAGAGHNKAIIGVGSGPSLSKNLHVLKEIHDRDGVRNPEDKDFLICSSNHQFRPLLEAGIIPDFVFLVDASKIAYDQIIRDIPPEGENCILIAGYHCDPETLRAWSKAGRAIKFYLSDNKGMKQMFRNITGKNPNPYGIINGGNVLNSMWAITSKFFGSRTFMGIGNDLSYPSGKSIKKRRAGYYQDGDYSVNMPKNEGGKGTGRDEAKQNIQWMSFKITDSNLCNLDGSQKIPGIAGDEIVGTSNTLWVYKTWLEEACLITAANDKARFRYYNCTEGGVLGVLAKSTDPKEMVKDENWFMVDEVCKRYHTTTLKYATDQFSRAKEILRCQLGGRHLNALNAGGSGPMTGVDIVGRAIFK